MVIGGRNKYLINGVNANNTRVQDLFCSVGLNVNNPHFLIMQVSFCISASKKNSRIFTSYNTSNILGEDNQSSQHEATRGKLETWTSPKTIPVWFDSNICVLRSLPWLKKQQAPGCMSAKRSVLKRQLKKKKPSWRKFRQYVKRQINCPVLLVFTSSAKFELFNLAPFFFFFYPFRFWVRK